MGKNINSGRVNFHVTDNSFITWLIPCSDIDTVLATGTAKAKWPSDVTGTIISVKGNIGTASNATFTFDINKAGSSILSTKLTIDTGELTSETAATAAVISDTSVSKDDWFSVDFDTTGAGAKCAWVTILIQITTL